MDDSTKELAREWLMRAMHDLQAAKILAGASGGPLDAAIYHCQQAAEKAVKAWLQSKDARFAKTHDIEDLLEQAAKLDAGFRQFEVAATVLTPYVSAFRYPAGGDEFMPSREEFNEALLHAQSICDFVLTLLPVEAPPPDGQESVKPTFDSRANEQK